MPGDGDGKVLAGLQLGTGLALSGPPVRAVGHGHTMRLSEDRSAARVSVTLVELIGRGSHAAVFRSRVGERTRAVRMEIYYRHAVDAYRRAVMVLANTLADEDPASFPSLQRGSVSFMATLPPGSGGRLDGAEVVCDVVEMCEPLAETVAAHPNGLPPATAVRRMLPVMTTVNSMHSRGWYHRDLDEYNVLAASDASLRVADLGIVSMDSDRDGHTFTFLYGKPFSTPPEGRRAVMAGGEAVQRFRIGPSYDTWQLGRLLYVLLTGDKAQVPELAHIDPTTRWYRWSSIVSGELAAVVRGLVDPDPETRITLGEGQRRLTQWLAPPPTVPAHTHGSARSETSDTVSIGSATGNTIVLSGLAPTHLEALRTRRGTWVVRDVSPKRAGFEVGGRRAMWAEVAAGQVIRIGGHEVTLGSVDAVSQVGVGRGGPRTAKGAK